MNTYSELMHAALEDYNHPYLYPTAKPVLERRYLAKDADGNITESWDGLCRRVARNLASVEDVHNQAVRTDEFYKVMVRQDFLPNSPTLMNAGRELQQLSACFVLPVDDSLDDIFEQVKRTAMIHKSGGGTGFSFSRLRPAGDVVGSTGGVASGPVSFINAFDAATDVVKQGGTRRGANMGILRCDHPDIHEFIDIKAEDENALQNFNISVGVTDAFMEKATMNPAGWYCHVNPRTGFAHDERIYDADCTLDRICETAWATGDPGLVFLDKINRHHVNPHLGKIEATNPCGEQPLLPYESCNLGSINLARMVEYHPDTGPKPDWVKISETVRTGVRMLDHVIDANRYPIPEIEEATKRTRRIGLGVMGWADMLVQLGIRYDSEAALDMAKQVMSFIRLWAHKASNKLAEEYGCYPEWNASNYAVDGYPMRNTEPTTIAPTGTISIIAGASSGIEPLFALCYTRNVMDGTRLVEVNPYFEKVARHYELWSDDLAARVAAAGSLEGIAEVPDWVKEVFRVSHQIEPIWHIKMQAAFQKYTDNAVSKTINLPATATIQDIRDAYVEAWCQGLKGITVYRDGSKAGQVLTAGAHTPETAIMGAVRERPRLTRGTTERIRTGHGNLYVTVNSDEGGPFEVFTLLGKAGGCDSALLEAISRLVSLALRGGIPAEDVAAQLAGLTCCPSWDEGTQVLSPADGMATALYHALDKEKPAPPGREACPECPGAVARIEGCLTCQSCGWSKC